MIHKAHKITPLFHQACIHLGVWYVRHRKSIQVWISSVTCSCLCKWVTHSRRLTSGREVASFSGIRRMVVQLHISKHNSKIMLSLNPGKSQN